MISSQIPWPLDYEAGHTRPVTGTLYVYLFRCMKEKQKELQKSSRDGGNLGSLWSTIFQLLEICSSYRYLPQITQTFKHFSLSCKLSIPLVALLKNWMLNKFYVIHKPCITRLYTLMVPTAVREYIKVSLYTQWTFNVSRPTMWPSSGM